MPGESHRKIYRCIYKLASLQAGTGTQHAVASATLLAEPRLQPRDPIELC
jgi:hypothetical protein